MKKLLLLILMVGIFGSVYAVEFSMKSSVGNGKLNYSLRQELHLSGYSNVEQPIETEAITDYTQLSVGIEANLFPVTKAFKRENSLYPSLKICADFDWRMALKEKFSYYSIPGYLKFELNFITGTIVQPTISISGGLTLNNFREDYAIGNSTIGTMVGGAVGAKIAEVFTIAAVYRYDTLGQKELITINTLMVNKSGMVLGWGEAKYTSQVSSTMMGINATYKF